MKDIWFVSDTHFFHANMLKFLREDGTRVRSEFQSVEEMNETMIQNWNSVVKHDHHVYHLGDVTFRYDQPFRHLMSRLNGRKRLIFGNHDKVKGTVLLDYFEKFSLWRHWKDQNFVCSHIPLRLDSMRHAEFNVHGHIHEKNLLDKRYINVSVEQIKYTPIHMDEIIARIKASS